MGCPECGSRLHGSCNYVDTVGDARDAVITAAEDLFAGYMAEDQTLTAWKNDSALDNRLWSLFLCIEALQAAEG